MVALRRHAIQQYQKLEDGSLPKQFRSAATVEAADAVVVVEKFLEFFSANKIFEELNRASSTSQSVSQSGSRLAITGERDRKSKFQINCSMLDRAALAGQPASLLMIWKPLVLWSIFALRRLQRQKVIRQTSQCRSDCIVFFLAAAAASGLPRCYSCVASIRRSSIGSIRPAIGLLTVSLARHSTSSTTCLMRRRDSSFGKFVVDVFFFF